MKLDTDIPIPDRYRRDLYPFEEMKIGDSFAVAKERYNTIRSAASRYKHDHPGWDYRTNIQDGVIRCWCTAVPKTKNRKDSK